MRKFEENLNALNGVLGNFENQNENEYEEDEDEPNYEAD